MSITPFREDGDNRLRVCCSLLAPFEAYLLYMNCRLLSITFCNYAAASVNSEMLMFYFSLGRDIVSMNADNVYGSGFWEKLSADLKRLIPAAKREFNTLRGSKRAQSQTGLYFFVKKVKNKCCMCCNLVI